MWFILSLLATCMLVMRRTTEKKLADQIPSSSLAWLQQATALPFMALMLPFATWFNPFQLSAQFMLLLTAYASLAAVDLILYYKAIQIGDISLIAPLINLTSVSAIIASFVFLGQTPSKAGLAGALLLVMGAAIVVKHKNKILTKATNNSAAVLIALCLVLIRGAFSPIEVTLLRETNAIYLNFISSLLTVPITLMIVKVRNKKRKNETTFALLKSHKFALAFIGFNMAINIYFTLTAKSLAPNAGYVTAIKGAQIIPMTFIGVFLFKEHVTRNQWFGIVLILCGLATFLFS